MDINYLQEKSEGIRQRIIDFHKKNKKSHIGSSLSAVEIVTSLYYGIMKEKDTFILSKGHASSVLYIVLNDLKKIPDEVLPRLEEHPKFNKDYGIYASTGSLGHGLSIGLGIAIADKDNLVYVLLGDGECDEGQVWEAARLASELDVKNLRAIIDCNGFQGFKNTDYSNLGKKFNSFGWKTASCDGHNCNEIVNFLNMEKDYPFALLARTIKGKGIASIEDKLESHYHHF